MPTAEAVARYEKASPLLLALESAQAPPIRLDASREALNWNRERMHLEARMQMQRSWRFSFLQHWVLISEYLDPRRSLWLSQGGVDQPVANAMVRGLPINQAIVDPTGTYARDVCAAGMKEGLMSSSRPWFKYKPGIKDFPLDRDGQIWYEELEDRVSMVMAESNFYRSATQMFRDVVTFATAPMLIYEDDEEIISCHVPVVGEYFLQVGPSFRSEGFSRLYVLTVSQLVEEFGLKACPNDVAVLWQQKGAALEREFIIAHAIEPNYGLQETDDEEIGVVPGGFTWRETYWVWARESAMPLSKRGFKDLPFIALRWAVNGNDPYGTSSPGMISLGDIMQLQMETRRKAELLEKVVRPPLNTPIELKNQPSSILPGQNNYVTDTSKGIQPAIKVDPQGLPGITADIALIQQRIKTGFFNDLFLMLAQTTKDMTAFEVAQRQQEKLTVLGPVIDEFQNEASRAHKRILAIMTRKGLIPPMPPSLRGVPMKIEYTGMLYLAQKAARTAATERFVELVEKVTGVYNEAPDVVNWDEMLLEYADDLSVSHKAVNDKDAIAKLRQARAQAQQQAKMAQAMTHTLPAMADAAKSFGAVDVGGGVNAAQAMMGQIGGIGGAGGASGVTQ
jgi:head-to-tail connecting protein